MKTVVGYDERLDKHYPVTKQKRYGTMNTPKKERSCFYDFGARSTLEFSGYEDDGYDEVMSDFMNRVKDYFDHACK